MTPDAPHDELLFRYVAGTCAPRECAVVEAWIRHDSANALRVEDIRRIWLASRPAPPRDVDRMWTRLHDAANHGDARAPTAEGGTRVRAPAQTGGEFAPLSTRKIPAVAWAAAAVLMVGGAAFFTVRARSVSVPSARPDVHIYATGPAQTANIRLRDGSTVTLAPESRLRVPDDFGDHARVVALDGEGFFSVVHDATMPFRVRAKGAVAEDIGTRFDLRAYGDEAGVSLIVADGVVTLGQADSAAASSKPRGAEGAIVRRGERARFVDADGSTTVDQVPISMTDWTKGRLTFDRAPLAEIARTIARWYDMDVRVVDATMRQRLITADFDTQSPREMVEALATATGGEVEQQGRVLTIRKRP